MYSIISEEEKAHRKIFITFIRFLLGLSALKFHSAGYEINFATDEPRWLAHKMYPPAADIFTWQNSKFLRRMHILSVHFMDTIAMMLSTNLKRRQWKNLKQNCFYWSVGDEKLQNVFTFHQLKLKRLLILTILVTFFGCIHTKWSCGRWGSQVSCN